MSEQNYATAEQQAELMKYISDTMKFPIMGAGGGFAPIGKEGYVDGTLAPEGWLICDGSTHNIADYPELATYFASHHGSANYYGGDGVTTFAVPTRNGMPTSGVDTPDEHIVGEWRETVDGALKKKPLYKKTIVNAVTLPSVNNTAVYELGSGYIIRDYDGYAKDSNGNPTYLLKFSGNNAPLNIYLNTSNTGNVNFAVGTGNADWVGRKVDIILEYTKTTDEWQTVQEGHSSDGNGVFCVKATVAGDANGHVYSTEEQVVGTDENGNIEYEKTLIGIWHWPSSKSWAPIAHNIANVSKIRVIESCVYPSNDVGATYPLTYYDGTNYAMVNINQTNMYFLGSGLDADCTYRIVARYTKTQ